MTTNPSSTSPLADFYQARRLELWTLVTLVLLCCGLSYATHTGKTQAFDNHVFEVLRAENSARPLGPAWLQDAFRDITALGSWALLTGFVLLLSGYWLVKERGLWVLLIMVASLGAWGISVACKLSFDRPRPEYDTEWLLVHSPSYPSGHALLTAAIYLTAARLVAAKEPLRRVQVALYAMALFATFTVGFSRIYLGVHYLSDVLAGWLIGLSWALLCCLAIPHRKSVTS
ncbi:Undecaprenyl pyrophosphate phosphatase [Planctomycetales bacterium 10988]|nr:Undecaprenyl pyrophosphate phosphatase [Planctomycetales bacterium 10988]